MRSIAYVDPTWCEDSFRASSATWRCFQMERWVDGAVTAMTVTRGASDRLAQIERCVWLVLEAIYRDGISAAWLGPEDMMWARRIGLAVLGEGSGASSLALEVKSLLTDGQSAPAARGETAAWRLCSRLHAGERLLYAMARPALATAANGSLNAEDAAPPLAASEPVLRKLDLLLASARRRVDGPNVPAELRLRPETTEATP